MVLDGFVPVSSSVFSRAPDGRGVPTGEAVRSLSDEEDLSGPLLGFITGFVARVRRPAGPLTEFSGCEDENFLAGSLDSDLNRFLVAKA